MQIRRIAIFCNPKSGKGKPLKLLPELQKYLAEQNIPFQSFIGTLPENLNAFTDVCILGGDGSVNFILNHFKEITIPISIIPCGTGNDIAFGILGRLTVNDYFSIAIHGKPSPIDAGVCNNKLFLNGVGIGFDGWVVKRLLAKGLFTGKAAYYSTVISLLLFYRESPVTIVSATNTEETNLFMFCAANGKSYGGGFLVAPKASFTDGFLDFLLVRKISLWNRLKYLPLIEKGKHLNKEEKFLRFDHDKKVTITSPSKLQAHLDGEWMESNTFEINILPQYINLRTQA